MNYGLYTAGSGILTNMYRQDVLANNLANIATAGFKPDVVATIHRDAARVEDGLLHLPSNVMLERLGGGVLMAPNRIALEQGSLERTDGPLDVAIQGEGFFVVAAGEGTNSERIRLSRDGRLTLDGQGRLVQAASGLPLLDAGDRPIRVDPTQTVQIEPDGSVSQGGALVGRIQLSTVPGAEMLEKAGDGLYRLSPEAIASRQPASGQLAQGHIERSAVDPIRTMMGITSAASAVSSNARVIQIIDEMLGRTFSTFARLA